ncbi:AmmeMemoRadiSam system protein B, partial [bacterium]|nr:AmmeMemoRadiSam system protein B [bacterium]
MMRFGPLTWSVIAMLLFTASGEPAFGGTKARPSAVAGSFYPAEPGALRMAVRAFLDRAVPARHERPFALIVPHAGYVYSGQIAADGFRQVEGRDYDVVVILGVNHRASGFQGISVYDGPGYRTPLGTAACDRTLADALRRADERFAYEPRADSSEHSIEVQIPFLQTVLPGVPIVPVVVGGHDERLWDAFARALASALEGRKPLIVASSDLSHYPPHAEACASDRAVLAAVATLDPGEVRWTIEKQMRSSRADLATCACGEGPIVIAMKAAKLLGAGHAAVLGYANSGDTAVGDRSRCVGYGAVAILPGAGEADTAALSPVKPGPAEAELTDVDRRALLEFARATIRQYLDSETAPLFRG